MTPKRSLVSWTCSPASESAGCRAKAAPRLPLADRRLRSRNRTYACCFSLENSDHIWREYGTGSAHGKVGIAFDFTKLRAVINETMKVRNGLLYRGNTCKQIFSVNYGVVDYLSWEEARENIERLPNPIRYTYVKDKTYANERELRISLFANGMVHFCLADGTKMEFPPGLELGFDFRQAMVDGTITEIFPGPGCDLDFLRDELAKLGIKATDSDGVDGAA